METAESAGTALTEREGLNNSGYRTKSIWPSIGPVDSPTGAMHN